MAAVTLLVSFVMIVGGSQEMTTEKTVPGTDAGGRDPLTQLSLRKPHFHVLEALCCPPSEPIAFHPFQTRF